MAKTFKTASISLADLVRFRHRCAWNGCTESIPMRESIPRDWRWLAVWHGPPGMPPWTYGNVEDRDAILCPTHARELDGLLVDIGNRLKDTKGKA